MSVIIGKLEDISTKAGSTMQCNVYKGRWVAADSDPIISTPPAPHIFRKMELDGFFSSRMRWAGKNVFAFKRKYMPCFPLNLKISCAIFLFEPEMLKYLVEAVQIVLEMPITIQTNLEPLCIFSKSWPAQPDVNPKLSVNETLEANF